MKRSKELMDLADHYFGVQDLSGLHKCAEELADLCEMLETENKRLREAIVNRFISDWTVMG